MSEPFADVGGQIVLIVDRLPVPPGPGRLLATPASRDRTLPLYLAAAAALALLLALTQVVPIREGAGSLAEQLLRRSASSTDRTAPEVKGRPAGAAEVMFRARQIIDQTRYLKLERRQRGTYYVPPELSRDALCPPVCYPREGFYDEEWTRTWRYDFRDQRAHVVIRRPEAGWYLEKVYVGSRSYFRAEENGSWSIQDYYVEGAVRDNFAGGVYEQYNSLGYTGPWPRTNFRDGFTSKQVFEDQIITTAGYQPVFGPDVACGSARCWTISISTIEVAPSGLQGPATWTLVVDQRTGRAVEARDVVRWEHGQRLEAVTRFFDYDVTNVIGPPR